MFQLEEGIQTECQGLSQAQEIKREVCSNGEDDSTSSRMSLKLIPPMGKGAFVRSLIFNKSGDLLFPPFYQSSTGKLRA